MKTQSGIGLVALLILVLATAPSLAGAPITSHDWGTGAPEATLGSYAMSAFSLDGRGEGAVVQTVAGPDSRTLGFDQDMLHYRVGSSWISWSHGYAGDVYQLDEISTGASAVTLVLPTGTRAFTFYVEGTYFDSPTAGVQFDFNVTVTNSVGEFLAVGPTSIASFGGARGFGFFASTAGDADLASITVEGIGTWPDGFALGEFGINRLPPNGVPDHSPTGVLLAGALAALTAAGRRRTR